MTGLIGLLLFAMPTSAAEDVEIDVYGDPDVEEVTVYGDLFARWDNTRWYIKTEVGLPYPMTLAKEQNGEFRTTGFQVRTILACSKQWKLGRHNYEVDCEIEDFAIRALVFDKKLAGANKGKYFDAMPVLEELDAKLTRAKMQLQVTDNGRVTNIDLEGVSKKNRRVSRIAESLRLIMSRVIVGFDMKLRKGNNLNEGQWVEYNPTLMSMPTPDFVSSRGSSMLIHQLDKYKGHRVVQSVGRGMITMGDGTTQDNYDAQYNGVSIYDHEEGYMTERVWSLDGKPTASSVSATGSSGRPYWHAGRIRFLDPDEIVDVGNTAQVTGPGEPPKTGFEEWWPLEED